MQKVIKLRSLALLLKKASLFMKNFSKPILLLTQVGIINSPKYIVMINNNKMHFRIVLPCSLDTE